MRRVLAVLLATGLALLAVGGMAQAKPGEGDSEVTGTVAIIGPGLSGPAELDRAATASYEDLSNVFNPGSRMHVRPAAVDLGPRFSLTFTLRCTGAAGTSTIYLHQDLYPYASYRDQSQVWTYTPPGQQAFCGRTSNELASGWNAARRGLFDTLTSAGLPRAAPVPAPAPVPGPLHLPAPAPDRFWPAVWAAGALLTLILVAVLAGRPRRKGRVLG